MGSLGDLGRRIDKALKEYMQKTMDEDKKLILQRVADGIYEDRTLSNLLKLDIYRVRVCLKELEQSGFIKLRKYVTFNTDGEENYLVTAITPEGRLALRNELPIDRIPGNNFSPQISQTFNAKVGIVQSGNFHGIDNEHSNEVINMEDDYQYVLEQDRKRFSVLKAIYRDSKGDKDKATETDYISKQTGICGEELLRILEFLERKGLIKPMGTLYAIYDGTAYVTITHQGMCEVEDAIKKPQESTKNFPAQVFQNTFYAPVGGLQQAGENNTFNAVQNIGSDEIYLDGKALEELQKFIDTLTQNKPNDLPQSHALQAAGILLELKEFAENQDKKGQIEAVSKWKQWLSKLPEKSLKALSITADLVTLALPLANLLGLPIP